MKRSQLKANPETTRAWNERSRAKARAREPTKRAPLKRARFKSAPPVQKPGCLPGSTLRVRAPARASDERKYRKRAEVFLRKRPHCARCLVEGRKRGATEVHHMAGKEGVFLLMEALWLPICRSCHDWIEAHGIEAIEQGYCISRHERGRYLGTEMEDP